MKNIYQYIATAATIALCSATASAVDYVTNLDQLTEPIVVNIYNNDGLIVASADEGVSATLFAFDDSKQWVIYRYRNTDYIYNLGTKACLSPDTENNAAVTDTELVPDVRMRYIDRLSGWVIDCGGYLLGLSSSNSYFVFLDDAVSNDNVIFTLMPSDRQLTDEEDATILAAIKAKFEEALQPYREFVANVKEFEANNTNIAGYAGSYDITALEAALETGSLADIDIAYQKALLTRLPKAGHYYRIANYCRPKANVFTNYLHIQRNTSNTLTSSGVTAPAFGKASNGSKEDLCLFTFEYPNANPYQVKVKAAATGTYFGTNSSGSPIPVTATVDNATVYEIEPMGDFVKLFRLKTASNSLRLTSAGNSALVPYGAIEDSEQWYFEEVKEISGITLNNGGYALIQLPCPVKMPEDVEFYVADHIKTDGSVVMEQLTGNVLAANTPVLIHSTTSATPLTLAISTDDEVEYDITHNLLSGTNVIATDVAIAQMQLNPEGTLQLIKDTSTTILPNSAYLESNDEADAILLTDDIETGINDVTTDSSENNEWYDLNGRRIVNPKQGIYINGTRNELQLIKK
jgi:hypothetical protein